MSRLRDLALWAIETLMGLLTHFPAAPLNERQGSAPFLAHASCRVCADSWKIFIPGGEETVANAALMCNSCEDTVGRFD